MLQVRDVPASVEFYSRLGFKLKNSHTPEGQSAPVWASVDSGRAVLMLARAEAPIEAAKQGVMLYLYFSFVPAAHAALVAAGISVGPIRHPFFSPRGEFDVVDPDGYRLVIAHT